MTYRLHDLTGKLRDGDPEPFKAFTARYIVIHRIWMNFWPLLEVHVRTVEELMRQFLTNPDVRGHTGSNIPYHLVVDVRGEAYQTLKMTERGAHAFRFNHEALGIACVGDMREDACTSRQWNTLVDLCGDVCQAHDLHPMGTNYWDDDRDEEHPSLIGHDELPGASRDPDKRCPGRHLPMDKLRQECGYYLQRRAIDEMMRGGLVL